MFTWIWVFLLCSWKIKTLFLKLEDQKWQTIKLEHYGDRGNLLKWVEDILSARTQELVVDGTKSTPLPESLKAQY